MLPAILFQSGDVPELELSTNAGSLSITVDEATELDGRVEMNAGSLELCADSSAAVAITIPDGNITFSHNLDYRGLDQSGEAALIVGETAGAARWADRHIEMRFGNVDTDKD